MAQGSSLDPASGIAAGACRISVDSSGQCDFQINAADMPVTVQLCEDKHGIPATSTRFFKITIFFKNSTNPSPNQPAQITNTTCKLPAQSAGPYDVQITVLHSPNAVGFVYEACANPNFQHQLCDLDTANSPNTSFSLRVI